MENACLKQEHQLKKGPWTAEEDQKLVDYIRKHGHSSWRQLPMQAGLQRCGKSCRLRWTNYLRPDIKPDIKRGNFSWEEDRTIIELHAILGNKWSAIAAHLKGRTDNEIKNHWNTQLKRNLLRMGIDPVTHTPLFHLFASPLNCSCMTHPMPRLESEMHYLNHHFAHNTNINFHHNMLASAGASIASPCVQQQRLDEHLLQSLGPQNELNIYSSPLHMCEIKSSSGYECPKQQKEITTIFNGENNNNVAEDERIRMPLPSLLADYNMLDTLRPFACPRSYQGHLLLEDSNAHRDASVGFITGISEGSESNHNGATSL